MELFIFFPVEENEPKEDTRVPLHPVRRHGGRSARKLASLRQSARFNPSTALMLGAGQRDLRQKPKTIFKPYLLAPMIVFSSGVGRSL
jgi:hypothetical protein